MFNFRVFYLIVVYFDINQLINWFPNETKKRTKQHISYTYIGSFCAPKLQNKQESCINDFKKNTKYTSKQLVIRYMYNV